MNFYYDIPLNFFTKNYEAYEWFSNDEILEIKRIPIFLISSIDFKNIYLNNIQVSQEFLKQIENKSIVNNEKIKYIALFCDKNSTLALIFNEKGISIKRSNLLYKDDENICEISFTLKKYILDYTLLDKIEIKNDKRINTEIKNTISLEIDRLIKENNIIKLKYLFIEWFNDEETNPKNIIEKMKNKLNSGITTTEYRIYNLIKMSILKK